MTTDYSNKTFFIILLSFLMASMLNVYPLSAAIAIYRPMILIMVLIYWTIHQPRYVGLGTAFFVGLSCDLLFDTLLGQQAFCILLATFTVRFAGQYIHSYNQSTSWILASFCLVVFQVSLWIMQFVTQNLFMFIHWQSLVVSIIVWLPMSMFLRKAVRYTSRFTSTLN